MTAPAWLALFDKAEPQALTELLQNDPQQFSKRADVLCQLLNVYINEHRSNLKPKSAGGNWSYCTPDMLNAINLLSYLERLPNARIVNIGAVAEKLTELYFEFLEEGMPFTIMHKQRVNALKTADAIRKEKANTSHAQWQSWADVIWREKPRWRKGAVAAQIKEQHGIPLTADWIAYRIKKPKSD